MVHATADEDAARKRRAEVTAGLCIGVASILSVALMAHHPSPAGEDLAGTLAAIARERTLAGLVHGGLIVTMSVVLFGFAGFAAHLGWQLARVRLAMMAYALGMVAMFGAALVSGFVVPGLAAGYAGEPVENLEGLRPVLRLCHDLNQTLAKSGTIAMSIGIFVWSLVLLRQAMPARLIGVLGLVVGALPVIGLLSEHLRLDVHGMGAVVLAQAIWSVAVAVRLILPGPTR